MDCILTPTAISFGVGVSFFILIKVATVQKEDIMSKIIFSTGEVFTSEAPVTVYEAAQSLGLCSCWIHRARETFDRPEGKALLRAWGIPEHYRGVGNCILGYTDVKTVVKPRAEGRIIKIN